MVTTRETPVSLAALIAETLEWNIRNTALAGPRLDRLEERLPHGSGIDGRVIIDQCEGPGRTWDPSRGFRLHGSYHAMDSNGMYTGWFDFTVDVVSTFSGPTVALFWTNGNGPAEDYDTDDWYGVSDPSDYLIDVFGDAIREPVRRIDID